MSDDPREYGKNSHTNMPRGVTLTVGNHFDYYEQLPSSVRHALQEGTLDFCDVSIYRLVEQGWPETAILNELKNTEKKELRIFNQWHKKQFGTMSNHTNAKVPFQRYNSGPQRTYKRHRPIVTA